MNASRAWMTIAWFLIGFTGPVFGATPPDRIHYQGVLRDASDAPLDGDHDMVFRFWSAEAAGDEILIDTHDTAHANPVTTNGGLFGLELGGGVLADGTGPGVYASLAEVFRDHAEVWLEIEIGGQSLSPRVRVISAAYALNADHLDGVDSVSMLRSDTSDAYTSGTLTVGGTATLDIDGTLRMDGPVTKATSDKVGNFNSDLLDGMDSTDFAHIGHTHPGSSITSPVDEAVNADMVDGMHASEFAVSSHGHAGSDISGPVAQADNADTLDGKHASEFLDTSSTTQTKTGVLRVDSTAIPSSVGIEGYGDLAGGYFENTDQTSYAHLARRYYGVFSVGDNAGGYFEDGNQSGWAYVGREDTGIKGYGNSEGGYFRDLDSSAQAWTAVGDTGVRGYGDSEGGHFLDLDDSGVARVGHGDYGVWGSGDYAGGYFYDSNGSGTGHIGFEHFGVHGTGNEAGGYFRDINSTGQAWAGYGDYGIQASGESAGGYFYDASGSGRAYAARDDVGLYGEGFIAGGEFRHPGTASQVLLAYGGTGVYGGGTEIGGYLYDDDGSSSVYLASGNYGIDAFGAMVGGRFTDSNSTGFANVGYGNYGISAHGSYVGGHFEDTDSSGYAYVAYGDEGIYARGNTNGGRFSDADGSGFARIGYGDRGIWARGDFAGGTFSHPDGTTYWADVSTPVHKIVGTGAVSFQQNHPHDLGKAIVYAAPEGDEVAVYTRGQGRLVAGEARVPLGETFRWVANPDIGLTVHLTPRGDCNGLYAESLTTTELVVRELYGATSDVAFDYLVYGLRIGFEEIAVVRDKDRDAFPPTPDVLDRAYVEHPELRSYNALERYRAMRVAAGETGEIELAGSRALLAALDEQRVEALARAAEEAALELAEPSPVAEEADRPAPARPGDIDPDVALQAGAAMDVSPATSTVPVDEDGNVYGRSFRPSATDLASLVEVTEPVEPGDVLVIDAMRAGAMALARRAADSAVFGIVAAEPGVVLGSEPMGPELPHASPPGSPDGASVAPASADAGSRVPVAVSGMVICKVDAGYGAVRPGDLLTTSPTPGHAMRTDEPFAGTILGKALEPLDAGTGTIRVLVMLR